MSKSSSNRNKFADLRICGVASDSRTCMYVDEKLTRRFRGGFVGAGIRLRAGERRICFANADSRISMNVIVGDGIQLTLDFTQSPATLVAEYKEPLGTKEEIAEREMQSRNVNRFILVMINLLMILAVLRILATADIL